MNDLNVSTSYDDYMVMETILFTKNVWLQWFLNFHPERVISYERRVIIGITGKIIILSHGKKWSENKHV